MNGYKTMGWVQTSHCGVWAVGYVQASNYGLWAIVTGWDFLVGYNAPMACHG